MPKTGLLIAATAAASLTLAPAAANAGTTGFKVPVVSVHLHHTGVKEPGKLAVTIGVNACADDVQLAAVSEQTGAVIRSTVVKGEARVFTVVFTFTKKAPAGTWVVGDVFGRPCGRTGGQVAFNPAGGYFPSFRVVR